MSCTSAGMRVSSSTRAMLPLAIAVITGLGTSAPRARALGQQPGVVPAVADRLLAGAGRALDEQRRVAADRRGEVLAAPSVLAVPGHAEQQQRAVGGERGDGDLDQAPVADVLGRDRDPVGERAAQQVRRRPPTARASSPAAAGGRRPRRAPPARRRTAARRGRAGSWAGRWSWAFLLGFVSGLAGRLTGGLAARGPHRRSVSVAKAAASWTRNRSVSKMSVRPTVPPRPAGRARRGRARAPRPCPAGFAGPPSERARGPARVPTSRWGRRFGRSPS